MRVRACTLWCLCQNSAKMGCDSPDLIVGVRRGGGGTNFCWLPKTLLTKQLYRMHSTVESAKLTYLTTLESKVNDPNTLQKFYWAIINRVTNKCRAPKIPPLLINNMFILNCSAKAKLFNDVFSKQCKPINNASVLPPLNLLYGKRINHISIHSNLINSTFKPQQGNRVRWNIWSNATFM